MTKGSCLNVDQFTSVSPTEKVQVDLYVNETHVDFPISPRSLVIPAILMCSWFQCTGTEPFPLMITYYPYEKFAYSVNQFRLYCPHLQTITVDMACDETVGNIPHIYETILGYLNLEDRLVASTVCKQWEKAIFESQKLKKRVAVNAVRFDKHQKQHIIRSEDVVGRQYNSVVVFPKVKPQWQELHSALRMLNEKCPIKWIRLDGKHVPEVVSIQWLRNIRDFFPNLEELEIKLNPCYMNNVGWDKVFQQNTELQSLVVYDGNGYLMRSVQRFCRNLKKLHLMRFELTEPLGVLLNFPELEELVIDEIDVDEMEFEPTYRPTKLSLPHLRRLTILIAINAAHAQLRNVPVTIYAPSLRTVRLTDLLLFIKIRPGTLLHSYTLNIASLLTAHFASPRFFPGEPSSVTSVTVESNDLLLFAEKFLTSIKQQFPNVKWLIIDQEQDESTMIEVRSITAREMPGVSIVARNNHFRSRFFGFQLRDCFSDISFDNEVFFEEVVKKMGMAYGQLTVN